MRGNTVAFVYTPVVAVSLLWLFLFNPQFGVLNYLLDLVGLPRLGWISDPAWSKPSLILMSLWTVGGTMLIFLAGLQGVPQELYDAAAIDGANGWQRTRHVTIPLLTPTIFFNTVLGIIGALQTFAAAFIATEGGPGFATWFFSLHIWKQAFDYFNMGYGAALAWFFALIIVGLTILQMRLSRNWVFYYGE